MTLSRLWAVTVVVLVAAALVGAAIFMADGDDAADVDQVPPSVLHEENQSLNSIEAESAVTSSLTKAATAEEVFFTETQQYTSDVEALGGVGLDIAPGVSLTVVSVAGFDYCIQATHEDIVGTAWSYQSQEGRVRKEPCPPAAP